MRRKTDERRTVAKHELSSRHVTEKIFFVSSKLTLRFLKDFVEVTTIQGLQCTELKKQPTIKANGKQQSQVMSDTL